MEGCSIRGVRPGNRVRCSSGGCSKRLMSCCRRDDDDEGDGVERRGDGMRECASWLRAAVYGRDEDDEMEYTGRPLDGGETGGGALAGERLAVSVPRPECDWGIGARTGVGGGRMRAQARRSSRASTADAGPMVEAMFHSSLRAGEKPGMRVVGSCCSDSGENGRRMDKGCVGERGGERSEGRV